MNTAKEFIFPEMNDLGITKWCIDQMNGKIICCREKLYAFDGVKFNGSKQVISNLVCACISTLEKKYYEAINYRRGNACYYDVKHNRINLDDVKKYLKSANDFSYSNKLVAEIKNDMRIIVDDTALNKERYVLNAKNGTIDLTTGKLREHSHSDMITLCTSVDYQEESKSELWERIIDDVTIGDKGLAKYIQLLAGYIATGDTSEQIFPIWHGRGENGKSLVIKTIAKALGSYAQSAEIKTFLKRQQGAMTNDIARLAECRLVVTHELDGEDDMDEAFIKTITGEDKITSRFLRNEFFEYTPKFKVIMCVNVLPEINGSDKGISRRLVIIPFNAQFGDKRDNTLGEKLDNELTGVLSWIVQGAMKYIALKQSGKSLLSADVQPMVVKTLTSNFLNDQNPMKHFFTECLVREEGKRIPMLEVYRVYKDWVREEMISPLGKKSFNNNLEAMGYEKYSSNGKRCWKNLTLKLN